MTASNQSDHSPSTVPLQATSSDKTEPASETLVAGSKRGKFPLGGDYEPSDFSVICGRGKESFDHVGNCRFRILTTSFLESYSQAVNKKARSAILSEIVAMNRQAGGNFCRYEEGEWCEVGDHCAREKVSTLLRDLLHTQYRSSAKAKLSLRKARRIKKQNQRYEQQLVQATGHSDDSSTASSSSSSSSCWGRDSLGGGEHLPDDIFFDVEYVF
jgi:hypothetical protein